jgi:hypothetical protein
VTDPDRYWIGAVREGTGEAVALWDGGGRVVNRHGDLYGTAPHRIIPWGKVSIATDRAGDALLAGWRLRAEQGDDPDFTRIERDESERPA